MSDLAAMPSETRAVLQLLLRDGRTYAELADELELSPDAVRERAHTGLEALGANPGDVPPAQRRELSDHLLGQGSTLERAAAEALLAASPSARAWARERAAALAPIGAGRLPAIPGDDGAPVDAGRVSAGAPSRGAASAPAAGVATAAAVPGGPTGAPPAAGADAPAGGDPAAAKPLFGTFDADGGRRSSRAGGIALIAGGVVVVAVVLALVFGVFSGSDEPSTQASTGGAATGTTGTTGKSGNGLPAGSKLLGSVKLTGERTSKALGYAQLVRLKTGKLEMFIVAEKVQPGVYGIFLSNAQQQTKFIGYVPNKVDKQGIIATRGPLPADAAKYDELVVSKETVTAQDQATPTAPSQIVLSGKLTGL